MRKEEMEPPNASAGCVTCLAPFIVIKMLAMRKELPSSCQGCCFDFSSLLVSPNRLHGSAMHVVQRINKNSYYTYITWYLLL